MIKNCPSTIFIFIFIVLFFCFAHNGLFGQGKTVIVPGVGVGVLKLNGDINDVNTLIGRKKFSSAEKIESKEAGEEMWLSYKDLGMTLVYNSARQLSKIIVLTAGLLIENTSLGVGSSKKDIGKYLGEEIQESADYKDCPDRGIKFYFKNNVVYSIEVKRRPELKPKVPIKKQNGEDSLAFES